MFASCMVKGAPMRLRWRQGQVFVRLLWGTLAMLIPPGRALCADGPDRAFQVLDPPQFLVICACPTPDSKERLAAEVRRIGGRVLFIHSESQSFSVAAPTGDAGPFVAELAALPGVVTTLPLGVVQLH